MESHPHLGEPRGERDHVHWGNDPTDPLVQHTSAGRASDGGGAVSVAVFVVCSAGGEELR